MRFLKYSENPSWNMRMAQTMMPYSKRGSTPLCTWGAAVELVAGAAQAAVDGPQHRHRVEVLMHMQLGGEAHFQVAHPFFLVVDGQLVATALQGDLTLHHRAGIEEPGQVLGQIGIAVLEDQLTQP
jgi:hypothetical protein